MKNIFYCPKCKKLDVDFQFDERKDRYKITWSNPKDGWGRHITHIICPNCGYELSGFMFVAGMCNQGEDKEGLIEYVTSVIEGYSDNSYCNTDKLLDIIRKRLTKY